MSRDTVCRYSTDYTTDDASNSRVDEMTLDRTQEQKKKKKKESKQEQRQLEWSDSKKNYAKQVVLKDVVKENYIIIMSMVCEAASEKKNVEKKYLHSDFGMASEEIHIT